MHIKHKTLIVLIVLLIFFTASCSESTQQVEVVNPTPFLPEPTPTEEVEEITVTPVLYTAQGIPEVWLTLIRDFENVQIVENRDEANMVFEPMVGRTSNSAVYTSRMIYAAAVPFFTVKDAVSSSELKDLWKSTSDDGSFTEMVMEQATLDVLKGVWGNPGKALKAVASESLLQYCEENPHALAILPFEAISPRWKILKIDGLSPLDKPLAEDAYALTIKFNLFSHLPEASANGNVVQQFTTSIPTTNRDEARMTVLMMTGTTAITRVLSYKISIKGMEYPIEAVKDWFTNADIRHVSNESPLVEGCPVGDEFSSNLVFCTPPEMVEVLDLIGVNVIEMTGNHINDYGPENLEFTLRVYEDKGWNVYAAGADPESARRALLMEHNGNKLAFLGCNAVGPATVYANDDRAGAAECDFEYLTEKIRELKSQGYVVITTYQHEEEENLMYFEKISRDFQQAAGAGADIVQGSQAHSPMGFEFVGENLIHYGLGNFLFDQMVELNRREFIDRHIIYDGNYINTELLTAILVDWSRPTPMNEEDRIKLLEEVFTASLKRKNENN